MMMSSDTSKRYEAFPRHRLDLSQSIPVAERAWLLQYSYEFAVLGVPGLTAGVVYLSGDHIQSAAGELSECQACRQLGGPSDRA
jgi:hypothetical protein